MADEIWIDLLDPDQETIRDAVGIDLHDLAWDRLLAPSDPAHDVRPRLESHDDYVVGVLSVPAQLEGTGLLIFHEVDLIATPEHLVTIRKSLPDGGGAYRCDDIVKTAGRGAAGVGMSLYLLLDEVAEVFLDIVDRFDDEIDELEDNVEIWPGPQIHERVSDLRHNILHVRRALAPTRDLARGVLDDRTELEGIELFPRDVELHFADAYDKLLRGTDGLDLSRDLLAGVRDYHQAKVANDQNEVMKRLTVVASMLLVPTFIVGLYGQNFVDIPELRWHYGYLMSWVLIVITSFGQLVYFRRKRWI